MIDRILKTYGEVNTTVKHFPPENMALHKYYFSHHFWHVNFHYLPNIEEVSNITKKRCESLPENRFSQLSPSVRRKKHETVW